MAIESAVLDADEEAIKELEAQQKELADKQKELAEKAKELRDKKRPQVIAQVLLLKKQYGLTAVELEYEKAPATAKARNVSDVPAGTIIWEHDGYQQQAGKTGRGDPVAIEKLKGIFSTMTVDEAVKSAKHKLGIAWAKRRYKELMNPEATAAKKATAAQKATTAKKTTAAKKATTAA